jgi:hypothetical protein
MQTGPNAWVDIMRQSQLETLVREILSEDYVSLGIPKFTLSEDVDGQRASIACALINKRDGSNRAVEGTGVGMVDALFTGLKLSLAADYPSIEHILFVDFGLSAEFQGKENTSHSDAPLRVRLVVENSSGRHFEFNHRSRSISASSVGVVVECVEHFVNAELAVLRVYGWIADAKKRRRQDLVDKYTERLSDLVKNASYSESIERTKATTEIDPGPSEDELFSED